MVTLETLNHWLEFSAEYERLEFKKAKQQFDTKKLLRYCVALANEGGGLKAADKLIAPNGKWHKPIPTLQPRRKSKQK